MKGKFMTNSNKQNKDIIKVIEKWYGGKMVSDTLRFQKQYGFEAGKNNKTTWNNEADAIKQFFTTSGVKLSRAIKNLPKRKAFYFYG